MRHNTFVNEFGPFIQGPTIDAGGLTINVRFDNEDVIVDYDFLKALKEL